MASLPWLLVSQAAHWFSSRRAWASYRAAENTAIPREHDGSSKASDGLVWKLHKFTSTTSYRSNQVTDLRDGERIWSCFFSTVSWKKHYLLINLIWYTKAFKS